ncbi:MAG TPA: hypothetical protein VLQ91_03645 [Draconibacterium sp.]|nr:hypothetical protein [Draconibacterium sp.]
MNTNFSQPLSNGFERMKKALFQPFDISKWINIGFTAFLAGLTDCNRGGGGGGNSGSKISDVNWDEFFSFPETSWNWLVSHPLWFSLIITGVILLFVIAVMLSWLSSRGKFMFLDNVVNNRDEVVKPWNEYCKQGNSLFWWQFVYGWLVFAVFILFFVYSFGIFKNIHNGLIPEVAKFGFIFGIILTFICLLIVTSYISLFLTDFVVPLMYKHHVSATKAWSGFLRLFVNNMGSFIVYGLFIFVLGIAVAIGVIFLAVLTCCIGLLIIMIPFVGAVILLPVSYTFRAFSIEYLATFGDEFNLNSKNNEDQNEAIILT